VTDPDRSACRFFVSYSGVKLPLKLVNELDQDGLSNRNTYFRAHFDAQGHLVLCEKLVYGEIEFTHRYAYHANGVLKQAEITTADEETSVLCFDDAGTPIVD